MKIRVNKEKCTKRYILIYAIGITTILAIIAAIVLYGTRERQENYVYKETQVQYGTLTVGVTESGSVDIGIVEQTFDLDMSALQRVETGNSGGSGNTGGMGNAGGMGATGGMSTAGGRTTTGGTYSMNMFNQMLDGGGTVTGVGGDLSLTVSGVKVSVGQQVAEGDVLYEVAEESVSELEQELQDNVEKAKADLDAVYADQTLSKQTAEYTYESSLAYGDYAQTEYDTTVQSLKSTVEKNKLTLERAEVSLAEYQSRLEDITDSYNDAVQALANFQYSLDHTEPTDAYMYVYYYEYTEQAQQTVDSLKKQKEQLESNVEQARGNVETATKNYETSQRNLEQGLLSAEQTLALRQLAYSTAQETYDITLAYLEKDALTQEGIYQDTKEKWDEFSSYISGNSILAKYNGVITSVELDTGDSINTGSVLITLYDMDDVSMTVTIYEKDMTDIALGSKANISFTAYPDVIFSATVSDISDATTDNSGNIMYDVTVTIGGDVSGLFQGMTGDITFITEQSEETLYVLKRAVITENNRSYVKIKEEDGNIVKKEVTTGFTDGTYIQIVEGLSEGDIVLIESKVSGS